ncbi:MAG: GNAT family N-acetyltransferase [Phototrophicaceae bacterium]
MLALNSHSLSIRPITNKQEFKQFFEFPWVLYKDDPHWVPILLSMRRDLLDKKKNPAWEYMEGQYFGAWRGDKLVGTITAFINHRHNETWNEKIAWFGTFETYDDQDVAKGLLKIAEDWASERGYTTIRGPQSFTTHQETGVLVDGFEQPVIEMPYNPPYYQQLLEHAGYHKQMDMVSMYLSREMEAEVGTQSRIKKLADFACKRHNVTIRKFDTKRKKEDFRLFRDLYNEAWDKNLGFVPMTDRELQDLVDNLGMLVEPDMAFFAEINGEAVGFSLAVPDFNEMLKRAYPRPAMPEILSLLQVGWHWKVAKTTRGTRLPLMGVKEDYRDMGIHIALLSATYENLPEQYTHMDCGWILETNPLYAMSIKLGAIPYKTHRHYEKSWA